MRGKRAKMLRKLVGEVGPAKAERLNPTTTIINNLGKKVETAITFRYPDNSFQRVYKDMKKGIGIQ